MREFYGDPAEPLEQARAHFIEPDAAQPCWRFVIEERTPEGLRAVGEIQYHHPYPGPDWTWSAGIDIFIGEPGARNRGVGTEAVRTLLRYLFEVKGVHRVTIDPEPRNQRAIRAYEKAGFRFDGILRHHYREDGRYLDAYWISILEREWPEARDRWLREHPAAPGRR